MSFITLTHVYNMYNMMTGVKHKYYVINPSYAVIGKISMIGGSIFAKISKTLKRIKQNTDDWNHVAVLAIGDFYELPPVGKRPVYK